ncbi:transketolase [Streptomyces sp. NPDC051985]|uniref:transketolase n=1 Tax=Streptomyces sp. NPDC051985 TaxID=3155807 RepID=UPI00342DA11C
MADPQEVRRLEELTAELRRNLLRLSYGYSGPIHLGGDMSMAEILIALYHHTMNVDPTDFRAPDRDRFILSKGHGAVGMYTAMALRGYFDFEEIVATYGRLDSAYGMHPCKIQLPGVESSTGSLGHGLPIAVGLAFAARQRHRSHRVFCLMGDGETCEGSIWEAANTAGSYRLGNLVGIIDRNRQTQSSLEEDAMNLEPYPDRWAAFGWHVVEVDGHDVGALCDVLDSLPPVGRGRPTAVVAHTIKGKGVSFMERQVGWHANSLGEEQYHAALAEVNARLAARVGVAS